MEKIIKKWGNSLIIRFSPEEVEINNLKEGEIIEFNIIEKEDQSKCHH